MMFTVSDIRDQAYFLWLQAGQTYGQDMIFWDQARDCLGKSTDWDRAIELEVISEDVLYEYRETLNWKMISVYQPLTESAIRRFASYLDWDLVSLHQSLDENLIRHFEDQINWDHLLNNPRILLSESFILEFIDRIDLKLVAYRAPLSDNFLLEFTDRLDWNAISKQQFLSNMILHVFADKLNWPHICARQMLAENVIEEFADRMDWEAVSKYQILSEGFIERHLPRLNRVSLAWFQRMNYEFRIAHNFSMPDPKLSWLYATQDVKLERLSRKNRFEVVGDSIIAYKATRLNGFGLLNFRHKYEVGQSYESSCDCYLDLSSFGFHAATLEYASSGIFRNCPHSIFKVQIKLDDLGAIINSDSVVRCWKLTVLEQVK